MAIDPNLVIGAGKEVAGLIRDLIEEGRIGDYKQLAKFIRKLQDEKVREDRDHDDILSWTRNVKLFSATVIKEIPSKSQK